MKGRGRESASYELKCDDEGMSRDAKDVFQVAFSDWRRVLSELHFLKGPELCDRGERRRSITPGEPQHYRSTISAFLAPTSRSL